MRKHNLAFIDLEMTGMDISKHEIIEIGCIITTPRLKIIEEFEIKIKPKKIKNADPISLKISHYNKKNWQDAWQSKEAMEFLSKKTKDCIMIGQNIAFDFLFLENTFSKTKIKNLMHYHKLDTISIAWAKLNKKKKFNHFSLREMCRLFNIKNENPHSALSDARATFKLYKKLMTI